MHFNDLIFADTISIHVCMGNVTCKTRCTLFKKTFGKQKIEASKILSNEFQCNVKDIVKFNKNMNLVCDWDRDMKNVL